VFCLLAVAGLFLFGKAGLRRNQPQEEEQARGGKNLTLIGRAGDYASGAVITTFMGEASVRVNCP